MFQRRTLRAQKAQKKFQKSQMAVFSNFTESQGQKIRSWDLSS